MPYTRLELRKRLRSRVGEPYKASETSKNGRYLDADLNDSLNDSIHRIAQDAITPAGIPLLTKIGKLSVIQGEPRYQLPADFLQVYGDMLFFRSAGTRYALYRENLSDLIEGVSTTATSTVPVGYQLYPSSRFLITEGIATGGSATTLEDADRVNGSVNAFDDGAAVVDAEGTALAAADIVENVTDGSEGAISAVTDENTLTFATSTEDVGISGGARNDFRIGDRYRVWSAEYAGLELWIALPSSTTDATLFESHEDDDDTTAQIVGTNASAANIKQGQSFKVDEACVVRSAELYFGDDTGTPRGEVVVRIETDSSGPTGTLADFRAKASLATISESAWNVFVFYKPFRLSANTTYWLTVETEAQSDFYASPASNYHTVLSDDVAGYTNGTRSQWDVTWTADAASDLLFRVNQYNATESLEVPYVSKGRDLGGDTEIMDLPDSALEAVLLWGKYDAIQKGTMDRRDRREELETFQLYQAAIAALVSDLQRKHRPRFGQVADVTSPRMNLQETLENSQIPTPLTWTGR